MCVHTHHSSLPHSATAPRSPPPFLLQTCLVWAPRWGLKGMQKQAGKGSRPEFRSLK